MRFLSSNAGRALAAAALGTLILPLPRLLPTIATASNVIIQADDVQSEDLYVAGGRVIIEGTVEGDVVLAALELVVSGRVEGDITGVVRDRAVIGGEVEGSVRLAARRLLVSGRVADDVVVLSPTVRVEGEVARDLLAWAGSLAVTGTIGRDVKGQALNLDLDGTVVRDLDVSVRSLEVTAAARIDGDLVYRSSDEADIASGAVVAGQTIKRRSQAPLWLSAVKRIFGTVNVLAFVFGGILFAWTFRGTTTRGAARVRRKPWRTLAIGFGVMVLVPLVALALAVTLVGLPIALLLALGWLAALFFGPIPAVAALGRLVVRQRGGLLGGFVIGALIWRGAVWILPLGGAVLYLAAVAWGVGGWVMGAIEARAAAAPPDEEFFGPVRRRTDVPEDWQPPLAPEGLAEPGGAPPADEGGDA